MKRLELLLALCLFAVACGDDGSTADAGQDATVTDAPVEAAKDASKDVATEGATDATSIDAADSGDAATDAGADAITDAAPEAAPCDGGCKLFSYACKNGPYQPCTCLSLELSDPDPVCDAGTVNCFKDPCLGKTAACVTNACVVQ